MVAVQTCYYNFKIMFKILSFIIYVPFCRKSYLTKVEKTKVEAKPFFRCQGTLRLKEDLAPTTTKA
jgi:hypothetical protein